MQILRAIPDHAATLTAIAFAAKRHWGYPGRWIECWRDALTITPEFIVSHHTYIAVVDRGIAGFYALGRVESGLDLIHLWVLPDAMGGGIGRALFLHAVEQTRLLGYRALSIESDPNAEGFYRRMGARRVGMTIGEVEGEQRELPVLVVDVVEG